MLGLAFLHLLLTRGIADFYKIDYWAATICVTTRRPLTYHLTIDGESAQAQNALLSDKASNQSTKQTFRRGFSSTCTSTDGHMDQYLPWDQLILMQQLNCVCDTLAKWALMQAIISGYHDRQSQLLPWEDVALVIWGEKMTGDISRPLRFHASKEEVARSYLQSRTKNK